MTTEERISAVIDRAIADGVAPAVACRVEASGRTIASIDRGVMQLVDDSGEPLAADHLEPVTTETRFDLASLTKVYSALTLLQFVREGLLDVDAPIAEWLPSYRSDPARERVTLRHLLTHTSGLPATWSGWRVPLEDALRHQEQGPPLRARPIDARPLWREVAEIELEEPPGRRFAYSCVGFLTAQLLAESATGRGWEELVQDAVLTPLDLTATSFGTRPELAAATEYQPEWGRGVVRGTVHDETAWALGERCGNAGLFATADDVLSLTRWLRTGGTDGLRDAITKDQRHSVLPVAPSIAPATSLVLRIGEPWMAYPDHVGHTGFTGTSIEIAPEREISIVLLTNRVHPSRDRAGMTELRAAVSRAVWSESPPRR